MAQTTEKAEVTEATSVDAQEPQNEAANEATAASPSTGTALEADKADVSEGTPVDAEMPQREVVDEVAAANSYAEQAPEVETVEVSETAPADAEMPQEAVDEAMAGTAQEAEKAEVSEAAPLDAEMPQPELSDEASAPASVAQDATADASEAAIPEVEVLQQEKAEEAISGSSATRASQRRAATRKGSAAKASMVVLASKVRTLQQEAEAAHDRVASETEKLKAMEATIAALRTSAEAATAAAKRASTEFLRRQCEDRLSQLEADIPKRPRTPWSLFLKDVAVPGENVVKHAKKYKAIFDALSSDERQKYQNLHDAEKAFFLEFSETEAGRQNLAERNELLRKCRTTGGEELEQAMQAVQEDKATGALDSPPAKRSRKAEQTPSTQTAALDSPPAKSARGADQTPAKKLSKAPRSKGASSILDETVVVEATEAKMLEQLRNLAGRPEVLALGKSGGDLLSVLKKHNGMVNPAKRALMGV